MCFSASASFTASALLACLGIFAIKKTNNDRTLLLFAATPFFFAIQQFSEGVVWLSAAADPGGLTQRIATHVFLFFAYLFWPLWIPIAMSLIEPRGLRKNVCFASLIAGMLFTISTALKMAQEGTWSAIADCHIAYPNYGSGDTLTVTAVLYLIAVLLPIFISRMKGTGILASAIAMSLVITIARYPTHVVSVWCFFAAILSGFAIYVIEANKPRSHTR